MLTDAGSSGLGLAGHPRGRARRASTGAGTHWAIFPGTAWLLSRRGPLASAPGGPPGGQDRFPRGQRLPCSKCPYGSVGAGVAVAGVDWTAIQPVTATWGRRVHPRSVNHKAALCALLTLCQAPRCMATVTTNPGGTHPHVYKDPGGPPPPMPGETEAAESRVKQAGRGGCPPQT